MSQQKCKGQTRPPCKSKTFRSEKELQKSANRLAYGCNNKCSYSTPNDKNQKTCCRCCFCCRKKPPKPPYLQKKYLAYKKDKEKRMKKECKERMNEMMKIECERRQKLQKWQNCRKGTYACKESCSMKNLNPAYKSLAKDLYQAECMGRRKRCVDKREPFLLQKKVYYVRSTQSQPEDFQKAKEADKCHKKEKKKKKKSRGCFG